ncbi:Glycine dehydrogenase [Actinidia chinensis var. chinensis]|uniref:Glycine dehydrogenase n=1 Tax=Actinidia chinensis var. chinensis TaxID=1590841 RepID=A0A2R6RN01_ACTCC|nr:Glycine dehydrogenase [Actinidia chinensis var. chinensis]
MEMGSGEGSPHWSVFDGVKNIPTTPEALMTEINSAISANEYAHATALLQSASSCISKNKSSDVNSTSQYDARMADEAYKAGLASLAAGKLDEALHSLNISLSKCPPDKTTAVAKLQSLISLTSQQLQKPRR